MCDVTVQDNQRQDNSAWWPGYRQEIHCGSLVRGQQVCLFSTASRLALISRKLQAVHVECKRKDKLFQAHHINRTNALMWGQYIAWNGVPHDQVTLTCYIDSYIQNVFLFLSVTVMCLHIFRVQICQGRDAELNTIRVGAQCLWFLLWRWTLSSWKIWQPAVRPPNAPNQVLCTAFHIWTPQGNI